MILTVDSFPNPLVMFKEAIRRLARINENSVSPRHRIHAKEVKSTEERTQSKHFNTRVHLKYNKILICDDQTNHDEI